LLVTDVKILVFVGVLEQVIIIVASLRHRGLHGLRKGMVVRTVLKSRPGLAHLPNLVFFGITFFLLSVLDCRVRFGFSHRYGCLFLLFLGVIHRDILVLVVAAFETLSLSLGGGSLDLIFTSQFL
jgi:hypothetical protein